jgi:hypothetical protein
VPILQDVEAEITEELLVQLSNPTVVTLPEPTATVTILDDDQPTLDIVATIVQAEDDPRGAISVTVTMTGRSSSLVWVGYSTTHGTATAPSDFAATTGTLSWLPGETGERQFTIPVYNDDIYEQPSEALGAVLVAPLNAQLGNAACAITLTDSDPDVTIAIFDTTVSEAVAGGVAVVTVTMTGRSNTTVSVAYTADGGTALPGVHYTPVSGTLVWLPEESGSRTFGVPLINDDVFQPIRVVELRLGDFQSSALGQDNALLTIEEDEPEPAVVVTDVEVAEGGAVTVTLSLATKCYTEVSADYATEDASATAGEDYLGAAGSVSWAPGETGSRTFVLETLDDDLAEGEFEVLYVHVTNVRNGTVVGDGRGVVKILDDERSLNSVYTLQVSGEVWRGAKLKARMKGFLVVDRQLNLVTAIYSGKIGTQAELVVEPWHEGEAELTRSTAMGEDGLVEVFTARRESLPPDDEAFRYIAVSGLTTADVDLGVGVETLARQLRGTQLRADATEYAKLNYLARFDAELTTEVNQARATHAQLVELIADELRPAAAAVPVAAVLPADSAEVRIYSLSSWKVVRLGDGQTTKPKYGGYVVMQPSTGEVTALLTHKVGQQKYYRVEDWSTTANLHAGLVVGGSNQYERFTLVTDGELAEPAGLLGLRHFFGKQTAGVKVGTEQTADLAKSLEALFFATDPTGETHESGSAKLSFAAKATIASNDAGDDVAAALERLIGELGTGYLPEP